MQPTTLTRVENPQDLEEFFNPHFILQNIQKISDPCERRPRTSLLQIVRKSI